MQLGRTNKGVESWTARGGSLQSRVFAAKEKNAHENHRNRGSGLVTHFIRFRC